MLPKVGAPLLSRVSRLKAVPAWLDSQEMSYMDVAPT